MRTLFALLSLSAAAFAQDAARPFVRAPRTVVAPPKLPAPPAVESAPFERVQPPPPPAIAPASETRGHALPALADAAGPMRLEGALADARADVRARLHFATIDGRIWARGRDYKASFGAEGLTFVPFLGADAPQSYPVTFALESIHGASGAVELEGQARAVSDGERVTIDRGVVDEIYAPGVDGVEQSFVLEERPASGECVLRVSVAGELEFAGAGDTIRFGNDRGGVDFGGAFVVNPDGSKLALPTEFVDGAIEIRLSDELLASARYPLVVDPIITTFSIPAGPIITQPTVNIDVAFDASTNRALYVTEEVYSTTDHDVLATLVDGSGNFIASNYFDFTSDDWVGIKVATYADYDEFLAVATVRIGAGIPRVIRGVLFRPVLPLTWNAPFNIATSTDALINPDVGGDPYPGFSYFCVVWERVKSTTDHDIEYCTVDGTGVLSNVGAVLDNSAGTYDSFPRISKSNMTNFWNIVWQRGLPAGDHDVYGASLNYFGASVLPSHGILVYAAYDDSFPVVTGNLHTGERAVFELWNTGGNNSIYTTLVTGTTPGNVFAFPQTGPNQQTALNVDTDGLRIFATFADAITPTNAEAKLCEFQRVDGTWTAVRSDVVTSTASTISAIGGASLASKYSGGGTNGAMCGAVDVNGANTPAPVGAVYEQAPSGGQPNEFVQSVCLGYGAGATACPCGNNGAAGGGCGSSVIGIGAILYAGSGATLSNDGFYLNGADMPNGGALYFQGTALTQSGGTTGLAFGDGLLCLTGSIVRLGVKINSGGSSTYPGVGDPSISTQGGITEPGTRFYQVWYRDAAPGFCTAATFNLTNAMKVLWLW